MEMNRTEERRIALNPAQDKNVLLRLPLTSEERQWLTEQLDVLSVKEQYRLAASIRNTESLKDLAGKTGLELQAAILSGKQDVAVDAINCILDLHTYEVCFPVKDYADLGRYYLAYESTAPDGISQFLDLEQLGRQYAQQYPGIFVDDCYVRDPQVFLIPSYHGRALPTPDHMDWSVRLKLASPSVPDGVWISLPDYSEVQEGRPDEIHLALHVLGVSSIRECTLLDARCVLPELQNLMDTYGDLEDLIRDGNNLGYILQERGQGLPHFAEIFRGALALEQCTSLPVALEIGQNLRCYDFVQENSVESVSKKEFKSNPMISQCLDHAAYGAYLLQQRGYQRMVTGSYIRRNEREFQWERSPTPMEMTGP